MSFSELLAVFGPIFRAISIVIALFAIAVTLYGLWVIYNWAVNTYQEQHRRAMATKMERDELMLRRLKKSVSVRIEQREMANK